MSSEWIPIVKDIALWVGIGFIIWVSAKYDR
ncbi:hypothetical protein PP747_gp097 [Rhizobium phage RHph_Y38]|uniref:Uncharacterized protein n=1 Tax=Rhizobium phage RHph_Y38 TaxID=2509781 RepID=A0A7S5R2E7_9CAUD|nr:hypothetical protein PP747_gp097 [Rhizobium phage RHph_Y38]QIG67801.1 hypothetical protein EVB52_102 [Rhizobium phage RHph_Y38]